MYSSSVGAQMILTDFPYMLSFANVSNFENRPKIAAFVKLYRNQGNGENITFHTTRTQYR